MPYWPLPVLAPALEPGLDPAELVLTPGPVPAAPLDGPPATGGFCSFPLPSPELPPIEIGVAPFVLLFVLAVGPWEGGTVGAGELEDED